MGFKSSPTPPPQMPSGPMQASPAAMPIAARMQAMPQQQQMGAPAFGAQPMVASSGPHGLLPAPAAGNLSQVPPMQLASAIRNSKMRY